MMRILLVILVFALVINSHARILKIEHSDKFKAEAYHQKFSESPSPPSKELTAPLLVEIFMKVMKRKPSRPPPPAPVLPPPIENLSSIHEDLAEI
ncbi:hypothetical protein ACJIZ3_005024 [Penstemon smallii]|uniref:Uncharacterized protein n=1 Tax=Penstemon smallii TaxID=265156 RepID=A0ABD3S3Q7_9LAMI